MKFILLYIYIFYLGFVLYAGCQVAIANKKWLNLIPVAPILIVAGLMDVLFNQTAGRVIFWEITYTLTFSERLDLHFKDADWRGSVARKLGAFLDAILPSHIH